jgi:phage-related protein
MLQELFVKIGADFKDLEKGFANVDKKLKSFGKETTKVGQELSMNLTAPIVGLGLAIFATSQKTGDYADRILDLEAITGMTTEAIQEWQYVTKIAGVETEAVTDAAQKLTKQLTSMEGGTGKAAEALGMLGIEFDQFIELPIDERMETVIKALTEIEDPAERARIGTDLLGNAWQNIAPIVALGAEEIDKARQAANDMGVVMGSDALNDANNFRIGMEELKAQMGGLFNEIGAKLAPMLTETLLPIIQNDIIPLIVAFAEKIAGLIEKFQGLDEDTQKTILTIVAIVAAIGPVLIIVGKMITILGTVITVVKSLGAALTFLSITPVGLIIVAIVALIAAGVLIYKNWDTIKEKALEIWGKIKDFFVALFETMKGMFNKFIEFIKNLFFNFHPLGIIAKNWNPIKQFFTDLFNSIRDKIVSIFDGIVSKITGAIQTIRGAIDGVLSFFKSTKSQVESFTSGAKSGISSVATNIKDKIGNVVGKIPFLADGGIIKSPTLAMIGERGAEAVIPLDRMGDFSGVQPVNVYLDGRKITGTIAPQMVDMIRGRIGSAY